MFHYEKKLQFPVKISTPNPKLAAFIISQYGGPDGELGASMRYLSQRYSMPYAEAKGLLTDIGTEELGHMEMVAAIVHQLTRNLTDEEVRNNPTFAPYFVDHTTGVYPTAASGFPWTAAGIQSTGDPIADLTEDLAAEQKARLTYDNILRLSDDPDVNNVIRFLRERNDTKLNSTLRESLNTAFYKGKKRRTCPPLLPSPGFNKPFARRRERLGFSLNTTPRREKYGKETQEYQNPTQQGVGRPAVSRNKESQE